MGGASAQSLQGYAAVVWRHEWILPRALEVHNEEEGVGKGRLPFLFYICLLLYCMYYVLVVPLVMLA